MHYMPTHDKNCLQSMTKGQNIQSWITEGHQTWLCGYSIGLSLGRHGFYPHCAPRKSNNVSFNTVHIHAISMLWLPHVISHMSIHPSICPYCSGPMEARRKFNLEEIFYSCTQLTSSFWGRTSTSNRPTELSLTNLQWRCWQWVSLVWPWDFSRAAIQQNECLGFPSV